MQSPVRACLLARPAMMRRPIEMKRQPIEQATPSMAKRRSGKLLKDASAHPPPPGRRFRTSQMISPRPPTRRCFPQPTMIQYA